MFFFKKKRRRKTLCLSICFFWRRGERGGGDQSQTQTQTQTQKKTWNDDWDDSWAEVWYYGRVHPYLYLLSVYYSISSHLISSQNQTSPIFPFPLFPTSLPTPPPPLSLLKLIPTPLKRYIARKYWHQPPFSLIFTFFFLFFYLSFLPFIDYLSPPQTPNLPSRISDFPFSPYIQTKTETEMGTWPPRLGGFSLSSHRLFLSPRKRGRGEGMVHGVCISMTFMPSILFCFITFERWRREVRAKGEKRRRRGGGER